MAQELSQAELLDFLCQAGGRVANAALLAHFKRFLRDPRAPPALLQRRRELFKGFVNSVATVCQDGPDAAKYVVLRKRYRDLVGEEPAPHRARAAEPPQAPPARPRQPRQAGRERAGRAHGGEAAGPPRRRRRGEAERGAQLAAGEPAAGRRAGRCLPGAPCPGAEPPLPASSAAGCPGSPPARRALDGDTKGLRPRLLEAAGPEPLLLQERAQQADGLRLPVGEMGALPATGSGQQRIRDWILTHHSDFLPPKEQAWPVPAWSQSSNQDTCPAGGSLDSHPGPGTPALWPDSPLPVFRSIRSQLSLQDLEDAVDQGSSASEEGSSACRESGPRCPGGETGRENGYNRNSVGYKGSGVTPHINGLVVPLALAGQDHKNGRSPPHVTLLHRIVGRATTLGKAEGGGSKEQSKDLLKHKPRKMARLFSPNLDAPLSARLAPRQGPLGNAPFVERLALSPEGPAEHRSSLVPLDTREHTWLVRVATGSWMQARALFQEDPHLILRRDFISGFTVLHWVAKHGNAQVLEDFATGAKAAGIVLDVNVKSGCGYTPLHLAAIHSHPLIIKILVQKMRCWTQARDSSGKKPWQYLSASVSGEIWQLLGAPRGRTIFPAQPIVRTATTSSSSSSARKVSRKSSLAAYLKPQHIRWKRGNKCPPLLETEEYSD